MINIRKDDLPLLVILCGIVIYLNYIYLSKFYGVFWPIISGYDQYILSSLTVWGASDYLINPRNVFSHPGLAIFLLPLFFVNNVISYLVGSNCANFILGFILSVMYVIEGILIKRILTDYINLDSIVSSLLSLMFCSMGMCLLMSFTPDHFAFSQFFLVLYTYLLSKELSGKSNRRFMFLTKLCIFAITITNGIKIFIVDMLFQKSRNIKYIVSCIAVLSVSIIIALIFTKNFTQPTPTWDFYKSEYNASVNYCHFYTEESEIDGKCAKFNINNGASQEMQKQKDEFITTLHTNNAIHTIKTFYWLYYKRWMNNSESKWKAFIYNMFGESIILHHNSLNSFEVLYDNYSFRFLDVINYLIILLFFIGVLIGIKDKLLRTLFCFFSIDIIIHLACGFGIMEIYIYSPHYLFIIILTIGNLIKFLHKRWSKGSVILLTIFTLGCFINNIHEIVSYLL